MFNSSRECFLLLQNTLLTGINDVSFSSPVKEEYQKLLGGASIKRKINSPQVTTCQFNKQFNGKDFIQSLTGQENMSGQFVYGTGGLDFNKATISNYSLNLDRNGLGQISVEMKIRGDIKPATSLRTGSASGDISVKDQTPHITFFDLDSTNSAVNSISMQSTINSKPSYEIGSINSSDVKITSPVVTKISTNIEMLEQEVEDITGLVNKENFNKNISVIFSDLSDAANAKEIAEARITAEKIKNSGVSIDDLDFGFGACALNAFEFPGASLNSQDLQSTAGDIIKLKKDYTAYYNVPNNQSVVEHPTSQISCSVQINTVRASLNTAISRLELVNQIPPNLLEVVTSTGSDFESNTVGNIITNLFLFRGSYNFLDFESETLGTTNTDLNLLTGTSARFFSDFESELAGNTNNDLNLLTGTSARFFSDFESETPGSTNTDLHLLN
jgi:hypothetical protein